MFHSGWSSGSGSGSVTSTAAPWMWFFRRASRGASVSATDPRATLISTASSGSVSNSVTDKAAGRLRQRAGDHEVVRPREHLQEVLLAEPDDLVGRAAFEGVYTAGQNG